MKPLVLVKRYCFDEAILIDAIQPKLLWNSGLLGLAALFLVYSILSPMLDHQSNFEATLPAHLLVHPSRSDRVPPMFSYMISKTGLIAN